MNRKSRYVASENGEVKLIDLSRSISGDIELMKKWIGMFDGHGVAIYPKSMPYSDVEQMAQATWDRGLNQVSIVDREKSNITLVPLDRKLSKEFPGKDALWVARKLNEEISSDYFSKGIRIKNPKSFYNPNQTFYNISDVVRTPDELIIILSSLQGPDLWLTGCDEVSIVVDGKTYKQTKYEGLNGFEVEYFWSPDRGFYIQSMHFPAIPEGAKTVDLYDSETNALIIKKLQVSEDVSSFENIRTINLNASVLLKTPHLHVESDHFVATRVDFSDNETTIYAEMQIYEPHSFLGHVGSDFTLELGDGKILRPVRVDGVPLDKDFDRNGDHVNTPFQLIFPPISEDVWKKSIPILKGTVCHEPVTLELKEYESEVIQLSYESIDELPVGDFKTNQVSKYDGNSALYFAIEKISFDENGNMKVSGDSSGLLGNGTFSVSLGDEFNSQYNKCVIKGNGKEQELLICKLVAISSGQKRAFGYQFVKKDEEKTLFSIMMFTPQK